MKTLVSAAVFAALTTTAIAEPITIFISGNRSETPGLGIPAATTVISAEDIKKSGASNLYDLLRKQSFVQTFDSTGGGGNAIIDMRGFGESARSNIAILVNGRKINPTSDGGVTYLNTIDLSNVSKIEIVKGSAGVLFGHQAVGGLINVITKKHSNQKSSLSFTKGSYNTNAKQLNLVDNSIDSISVAVNLYEKESDNYRDQNATDLRRFNSSISFDNSLGETIFEYQYLSDDNQDPGPLTLAQIAQNPRQRDSGYTGNYTKNLSKTYRLSNKKILNQHWDLITDLSLKKDDRDAITIYGGTPYTINQFRDTIDINPRLIADLDKLHLTTGFDYQDNYYVIYGGYAQNISQKITAIYAQAQYEISDQISTTGGFRYSHLNSQMHYNGSNYNLDDDKQAFSAGITYSLQDESKISIRADQNFRFAQTDEHSSVVSSQPVGLKNQTGTSFELEYAWRYADQKSSIQLYELNLNDEIIYDGSTWTNFNLPKTRRIGLSLNSDVKLSDSVDLKIGYDYLDSKVLSGSFKGSEIPLAAKYSAQTTLNWKNPENITYQINWKYTGERFVGADFNNSLAKLDGFGIFDLSVTKDWRNFSLSATASNVLNEKYITSASLSGSNVGYYPGSERNYLLSLTYTFE